MSRKLPPELKLSTERIEALPTPLRPLKLHDGHGLFLLVKPDGSRYWRQNYTWAGKRKTLSAGVYPAISLEAARAESERLRATVAAGVDPSAIRKGERRASKVEALAAAARRPARFLIDQEGRLSICLPERLFVLSPAEAHELRGFLNATATVGGAQHG